MVLIIKFFISHPLKLPTMKRCMLWVVLSFITPLLLDAQSTKGEIRGKITDMKTRKPLDYCSVILFSGTTMKAQTLSDDDGSYIFKNLKEGTYSVKATTLGYLNSTLSDIEVKPDRITFSNIAMNVNTNAGIICCSIICCFKQKEIKQVEQSQLLKIRDDYKDEADLYFLCVLTHRSRKIENQLKENQVKLFNEVSAFPNPCSDHLNIESMYDGNKIVFVYNLDGTKVYEGKIVHHSIIDTNPFPPGIYIITLIDQTNDEKNYSKIIVSH